MRLSDRRTPRTYPTAEFHADAAFHNESRTRGRLLGPRTGNPGSGWFLPRRSHDLRCRAGGEARWRDRLAPVEFPAHHVQPIDAGFEGTGEASEKWRFLRVLKEVELGNDVVALFARLDHF